MIIGICGRMKSGKSELAKICEDHGYYKMSFAAPLKYLCSNILNITFNKLNELKNNGTDINFTFTEYACKKISSRTDIPLETVLEICNGKHIQTVRDMLQFIGTDVIRKYNPNWHVNEIKKDIKYSCLDNFVIDDVRFQNEKKMIEDIGGDCWFVTRTTLDNVSNHESETSITWKQCYNKVIINDSTLHAMLFKWEIFFNDYENSCTIRDKEFNRILENGTQDDIKSISKMNGLLLDKSLFTYTPKEFNKDDIEKHNNEQ